MTSTTSASNANRGNGTSVWDAVVGQPIVPALQQTVADASASLDGAPSGSMTHAWLFTGPPGSGRSVAAKAFAAALQCDSGGCGTCAECTDVRNGTHPDVAALVTEGLSIKISQVRELVPKAALRPARGRWQIVIVEDADRLGEDAADALLLSVEEPPDRTVWMLCAPTAEDIAPTIRSRCRVVQLRTPPSDAVATYLSTTEGIDKRTATFAARAAQGHIGRARALATDENARSRREEVLKLPFALDDLRQCLDAAASLVDAAKADAERHCDALDAREVDELKRALGAESTGRKPRNMDAAVKELEREQKLRRTRVQRDSIDRALIDVLALYRDVLMLQLGVRTELINDEMRASLDRLARNSRAESTLRRMEAIGQAREALMANAAPLLTLESMALTLREG
ncbi:DNA polymerase III subunit delta' [Actinobacteria bacterium YIM 96077]|uniref:DNA polymerase III subunit delta n=1 Tax=Phytoactinopolyspora halophila TaxID=1981511 RepID=A0A329R2G6_9ACTN|nr:DNA polymerase III subunit delta' [Actinobacteria bacterium YIM 96077]RAW18159.1 DNA polymerase III subunit delta' [Phytoactinopolyspora halophila]